MPSPAPGFLLQAPSSFLEVDEIQTITKTKTKTDILFLFFFPGIFRCGRAGPRFWVEVTWPGTLTLPFVICVTLALLLNLLKSL